MLEEEVELMSNPYTGYSVYTPYPFKELMAAGEIQQAREDKSYDALSKVQGLMGIEAAPVHQDYKNKVITPYRQKTKDLIDNISPKDPRFYRELTKLQNDFINDTNVQNIHQGKEAWDKVILPYYNNRENKFNINKDGYFNPDGSMNQTDKPLNTALNYTPAADVNGRLNKSFEQMKASMISNPGFYGDPKVVDIDGIKILDLTDVKTKGILERQMKNVAKRESNAMLNEPEYKNYWKDKAEYLEGKPFNNDNELKQSLNYYAEDLGQKYLYNDIDFSESTHVLPQRDDNNNKNEGLLNLPTTNTNIDVQDITNQESSSLLKRQKFSNGMLQKREFDITGKSYDEVKNKSSNVYQGIISPGVGQSQMPISKESYIKGQTEQDNQQINDQQYIKNLRVKYPDMNYQKDGNGKNIRPRTDTEILKLHQEALDKLGNLANYKYDLRENEQTLFQHQMIGEGKGDIRNAVISGPGFKGLSFRDAMDKLGYGSTEVPDDKVKTWKLTGINSYGPTGLEFTINAENENGENVILSASGSNPMQQASEISNGLLTGLLQGQTQGEVQDEQIDQQTGEKYVNTYGYTTEYNDKFNRFIPKYYVISGKTGEKKFTTLETIRKKELESLDNYYKFNRNTKNLGE